MGLTFEPLGKYVRLVDERNNELITEAVLGINIDKYFMPSVANVIGTDLSNYKLLRKGRFACNPMHVGRDGRLPVARYMDDSPAIVSPAYFMFETIDESTIDPEYLMLCFRRPDFDRMCWFRTDASVRGGITWDDVCDLVIPVPSITDQRKIVSDYQVITNRIELLRELNNNLETQEDVIFASMCLGANNEDWDEGYFSDLVLDNISGDWGAEEPTGNNKERVTCIRGTDIPSLNSGIIGNAPTRYILEKNFTKKSLKKDNLIIEISGGSPVQSTGRIALLTEDLLNKLSYRVICSNFCKAIVVKPDYLYFFFLMWRYLYKRNRLFDYENSTITLKNFDYQSFTTQEKIKLPDISTSKALNDTIKPLHDTIIKNGFEIETLLKIQEVVLPHIVINEG